MKKVLLASTAIVGATLIAAPAFAQPVVSDMYEVTISGNLRVSLVGANEDFEAVATSDRGYNLKSDESEVAFSASASMDNGIQYGFQLELQTQTNDTQNSDETWGFIDGFFGRIELGDQDDAADRIFVGGEDAGAGRGGFNGDAFALVDKGAAITGIGVNATGDATKVIYFTPRVAGVQGGISFTPDSGQVGSDGGGADTGSDFEEVISVGANFSQSHSGVTVTVAGIGEFGEAETATTNDIERLGFGGKIDYMGFSGAVGFVDNADTGISSAAATTGSSANGADAGYAISVGASYSTGPWKIGVAYLHGESDAGTFAATGTSIADPESNIVSVGGNYAVAPGLDIAADINFFSLENSLSSDASDDASAATTNNRDQDGTSFVLSASFGF